MSSIQLPPLDIDPIPSTRPSSNFEGATGIRNLGRGADPFDTTSSFAEDPFAGSSSGEDLRYRSNTDLETPALNHAPAFNRTFSAPLPNRIGNLRHPLPIEPTESPIQSISVELADSLQSAIQTLLHLSPPHLLDNAKEQYSGCTVQLPTTSLSALLTSMRSLNYLSANVAALCGDDGFQPRREDFDIGELLQSVADLLGGQAAQQGVDFVLFHGDVGIKHVSVEGDGEGLGYVLGHVLRQILAVAKRGDTIELGLQVIPQTGHPLDQGSRDSRSSDQGAPGRRSSSPGKTLPSPSSDDGPLLCVIEIVHNGTATIEPKLNTVLARKLLQQQNASLRISERAYEISVLLSRGKDLQEKLSEEEERIRQPFTSMRLAREPTLPELSSFAESLCGRKVNLHASLTSVFARHLTSYLAAWGLDVFHISSEEKEAATLSEFVMIDDDVSVLRHELLRIRAEASPLRLKRPTLSSRARSTPHVRQISTSRTGPVVIHFTSLANYCQVRDVISTFIGSPWHGGGHPDVMVIPKPVGPRRFLTALHTAVQQPLVDPFFSPIATSPRSPGGYFGPARTPSDLSRDTGFFLEEKPKSLPSEVPPHPLLPTPAEILATPASEYFTKSSASSALVMQSPDGRPFGMFFEPPKERRVSVRSDLTRRTSRRTSGADETPPVVAPAGEPESSRSGRRKTLPTPDHEPIVVPGRDRSSTVTARKRPITPKIKEEVVMPPINVLIVEDNPINQNILSMFLRKKKIKYQTAKDGLEAVEKWRTGGFHLILMDIQLPVMDGIEATKEIRKLERSNNIGVFPSTPVSEQPRMSISGPIPSSPFRSSVIIVALTASSMQSDRVSALAAGCNDFLTKPVSLKWLERKIVEWGCMQALIDFDGWRRWKRSDSVDGGKRLQTGFEANAQQVAGRLRINRAKNKPAIAVQSATPPLEPPPEVLASIHEVSESPITKLPNLPSV